MLVPKTALELKRREAGLTQQEVAELLGISRNTLAAYESGKTDIPISVFIRLADLYKCDVHDVFGVYAPHITFDLPKSELRHAHARYKLNKEKELNEQMGIEKAENYYEEKYKQYYNEIKID